MNTYLIVFCFFIRWQHIFKFYGKRWIIINKTWWMVLLNHYTLFVVLYIVIFINYKLIYCCKINYFFTNQINIIINIIGAAGAYMVGLIYCDWKKFGDIIFSIGTLVLALLLFVIYNSNTLWIIYVLYIMFGTLYNVLLTITT